MILELDTYSAASAVLLLRIILGILFISSGYDKLFRIGLPQVKLEYKNQLQRYKFPDFVFGFTAFYSAWVELIGGALLIIGLFKFITLSALGIDLIFVTIAMTLIQPLYDMKLVSVRLFLLTLIYFLHIPSGDYFSLDYFLFYK